MSNAENFELHFGVWWANHRHGVHRLFILGLLIVLVGVWGAFAVFGFQYLKFRSQQPIAVEQMLETQVDLPFVHRGLRPLPLSVQRSGAIRGAGGLSDVFAVVQNPNAYWAAKSFRYRFSGQSEQRSSFIPASGEKTLMDFLIEGLAPETPSIEISNIEWIRVQGETLPQSNFVITDPELSAVVSEKEGVKGRSTLLRFELANRSPHHFFSVIVKSVLTEGGRVIAINSVTLPKMLSQAQETIAMSWPQALPLNAKVEILPEVNVFDEANILVLPEGPKRSD